MSLQFNKIIKYSQEINAPTTWKFINYMLINSWYQENIHTVHNLSLTRKL